MITSEDVLVNFRTDRYALLNKCRWEHFLSMNLPLAGRTIFEPGAGVGDQTEWLLKQGPSQIYVNEVRDENREIIKERFGEDSRVTILPGNLEVCLSEFEFKVDFVFCYGVYYHLNEILWDFPIMQGFARIGETIALDYLAGNNSTASYGYDNPSTSLSQYGIRPEPETLLNVMKNIWGFAYQPKNQLDWHDPVASEDRRIAVASHSSLDNEQLEQI